MTPLLALALLQQPDPLADARVIRELILACEVLAEAHQAEKETIERITRVCEDVSVVNRQSLDALRTAHEAEIERLLARVKELEGERDDAIEVAKGKRRWYHIFTPWKWGRR